MLTFLAGSAPKESMVLKTKKIQGKKSVFTLKISIRFSYSSEACIYDSGYPRPMGGS